MSQAITCATEVLISGKGARQRQSYNGQVIENCSCIVRVRGV